MLLCILVNIGEEKQHTNIITIDSMDRHKGGLYICTANNGVGQPAINQVMVHVLCEYFFFFNNTFIL